MKQFEYITNGLGKRVLHLMLIISLFIGCKSCVSYLLFAKENFKCPICQVLKGIHTPRISIYRLSGKVLLPSEEIIVHKSEAKTDIPQKAIAYITPKNYGLYNSLPQLIELQNESLLKASLIKFYILNHQLKISPLFYVQKPVNDLQNLTT